MISHQPIDYVCPFCDWLAGNETEHKMNSDIVYQDDATVAFIAPKWWINNVGHVLVIPREHHENLYSITDKALADVYKTVRKVAIAMRGAYDCTGISIRQHNEPDGNQSVWHYHTHIYPRYSGDNLYKNHDQRRFAPPQERKKYADLLRETLS